MSLFFFNVYRTSEELLPPQLRKPKFIAWFRTILTPIRYLADLFNNEYINGAEYPNYDSGATYNKYDRVVFNYYEVYELKVTSSTGVQPKGDSLSSTNWRKILNDFIGVDERMKYNGSLIVFEYAINRRFRITAAPYIYVEPIVISATQTFVQINVPAAFYATLGPNDTARNNRIKEFAERYTLGGFFIVVIAF